MAAASSSGDTDHMAVDDLSLVALNHGINQDDATGPMAISDEDYAEELQLQEVIVSSAMAVIVSSAMAATASQSSLTAINGTAAVETPTAFVVESWSSSSSSPPALATPAAGEGTSVTALAGGAVLTANNNEAAAAVEIETPAFAVAESWASSSSWPPANAEICKICLDHVLPADAPRASRGCAHAFCAACLDRHIGAKNQDGVSDVRCPGEDCCSVLDPELCQGIISRDAFEGWSAALCMAMVLRDSSVCYCPFNDCSEIMADDHGGGEITESECPMCRRLFCARCGVPWHADITCDEYGQLAPEDFLALEMARGKNWRRCLRCKFWVEKNDGCIHITCRCGFEFCYRCGEPWGQSDHSSCNTG